MKIDVEIDVPPSVVLSIISNVHDSGVLLPYLDKRPKYLDYKWHQNLKENPSKWSSFRWVLFYDEQKYVITYKKVVLALQAMIADNQKGKYRNKYHNPLHVALGLDHGDCIFDAEVIEYVLFGKVIWA